MAHCDAVEGGRQPPHLSYTLKSLTKMLGVSLSLALPIVCAHAQELPTTIIGEDADFSEINGGLSDGTTDGETIILEEGVTFTVDPGRAHGLYSEADGATLVNNGTIQASGDFNWGDRAGAIRFGGNNGRVINTGIINADGKHMYGITSGDFWPDVGRSGNNTTIQNFGEVHLWARLHESIAAIDTRGYGVDIYNKKGAKIHVYDTGKVENYGIWLKSPYDGFVSNAGEITTEGHGGVGIYVETGLTANQYIDEALRVIATSTIFNSGAINTGRDFAPGIYSAIGLSSQHSLVVNTGTITTKGRNARAVEMSTGTATVVNSGTLDGADGSILFDKYDTAEKNGHSYMHLLEG